MNYKTVYVLLALLVAASQAVGANTIVKIHEIPGYENFVPVDFTIIPNAVDANLVERVDVLGNQNGTPTLVSIDPFAADPIVNVVNFSPLMTGGSVLATDLSQNGQYVAGVGQSATSDPAGIGEATVWSLADPTSPAGLGYGVSSPLNSSVAFGVANNGTAVGGSACSAIRWSGGSSEELTTLAGLTMMGTAFSISADGNRSVGSSTNAAFMVLATMWDNEGNPFALEDPYGWASNAYGISNAGNFITGYIDTGGVLFGMSLWDGDGNLLSFVPNDIDGNPVATIGFDVSDNGVVVGGTPGLVGPDSVGYIYMPGWTGVRTIDDWVLEVYGETIHSLRGLAVQSFGGYDYVLSQGSAYLFIAESSDVPPEAVPGPSGAVLVLFGVAELARRRARLARR